MSSSIGLLFIEFFKIGLFTYGGGYASLPFLYQISDIYHWFSNAELLQMIAVSGITPGPVGLNMATYAGFKTLGLKGSIISTLALVLPMILITSQVFRLYNKFCENRFIKSIIYILRPTSCALICAVGLKLFHNLIFDGGFSLKAFYVFIIPFLLTFQLKRNPIIYIVIGACLGILVTILHI